VACTTLQWHAAAVGAVAFSSDGSYLISGGVEAVLVLWSLVAGGTAVKQFLPRLGAPICQLAITAAAPATVAVTLKDNVVHVVDMAAVSVKASVRGLRPPVLGSGGKGAAASTAVVAARVLALQPGTASVAVAAAGASLQFFHPGADRHVSQLQVGSRNYVVAAAGLAESGAAEPAVVGAAFAAGGAALGTLDTRPRASAQGGGVAASAAAAAAGAAVAAGLGGGAAGAAAAAAAAQEYCLRFWDAAANAASGGVDGDGEAAWELNTRVDSPHQGAVTALVFHPHRQLAVTTSTDGTFKVGGLRTVETTAKPI
jgi:NET1-associated nuclear protein 1 (U3 small nucleolar RNA-associated protein 17)